MLTGTIIEYSGDYCFVRLDDGRKLLVRRRGKMDLIERERMRRAEERREREKVVFQKITVGDRVTIDEPEPEQYVIHEVLERETWLIRKSLGRYGRKPQCVVANADQLAVVMAPNPDIRINVIDRYFLAAIQGGLDALLVVNKIDIDPALTERVDLRNYREHGYRVIYTNARSGEGLDKLETELTDKFTVFCGHSGVGKSTILSAITGVEITTGEVKEKNLKGRQTTTSAHMYQLPLGGQVVDTPGIREFGLAHLTWLDVNEYFADIAAYSVKCSYRDCTHTVEPDCVVRRAVSEGKLGKHRLISYIKLREEAEKDKHWE